MPRRHDCLFGRIANFQALHDAARRAIKGKRKKPGAASFFANLEGELLALERQLRDGEYRPGHYVAFEVNDPKRRIVSAAPFRDRVVHHSLCAPVEPIFVCGGESIPERLLLFLQCKVSKMAQSGARRCPLLCRLPGAKRTRYAQREFFCF
jgi:hypothetical protein